MDLAFGSGSVCPRQTALAKNEPVLLHFCKSSLCALCPALRFMWWNRTVTTMLFQESIIRHGNYIVGNMLGMFNRALGVWNTRNTKLAERVAPRHTTRFENQLWPFFLEGV